MLVMLIRHAHAGDQDPAQWPDDRLRPLTEMGRDVQKRASRALARLRYEPEAVLTSPWLRARQTAEVVIREFELEVKPVDCEALTRSPDLDAIQACIGTRGEDSIVALVGHSPFLEELASLLLGGDARVAVDFPKSGALGLQMDQLAPGAATLEFFLRPKHLKKIDR